MSHIESVALRQYNAPLALTTQHETANPLVLVVEDDAGLFRSVEMVCEFLDLAVERISGHEDLLAALEERRPMAVISQMDGACQDGCFVMMTVAAFDRLLPVMMITGHDAALAGAADAIEELWGLDMVVSLPALPPVGGLVDFLFRAGRKAGVTRLMPV